MPQGIKKSFRTIKEHFQEWDLNHPSPEIFIKSEWVESKGPSRLYVWYRVVIALYFISWWLVGFCLFPQSKQSSHFWEYKGFFFTFLTYWGITVLTCDIILQAVIVVQAYHTVKRQECPVVDRMSESLKLSWSLEAINNSLAVTISLIYWIFLFDADKWSKYGTSFHIHVMNTLYVIVNQLITARPVRPAHIIFPAIFGSAYVLFNLFYYLVGGKSLHGDPYIYSIMDWRKPGTSIIIVLGAFLILCLAHALSFGIYYARKKIYVRKSGLVVVKLQETESFRTDTTTEEV